MSVGPVGHHVGLWRSSESGVKVCEVVWGLCRWLILWVWRALKRVLIHHYHAHKAFKWLCSLSAPFTLCITWIFAYIHIRLMIIRYILRHLIWLIASRWDVSTWRNNNRNSEIVFRFPRGKNIWIWGDLGIFKLSVMTIRFPFERHPALSNVVYWTAPK